MTSEDDHDAAYLAAIRASERLRADRQKAAEQAFFDVTDQAYADHAARDRAYAIASDGRQGVYDRAAQDHFDRVAATQRHFGQAIRAHGNPDAPHAQAWLATLDVEAFRADPEPSPVTETPAPTAAIPKPTDALSIDREVPSRSPPAPAAPAAPEPTPEPPPGLVADIQAALARTTR
jgi:hypothetical protein